MQTSWAMHNRRGGKLSTKQIKRGSCAPSRRPHKAASYVCPLRIFGVESMQRIRGGSFQVIQMCNLLSWDSFLTSLINSRGLDINAHISIFSKHIFQVLDFWNLRDDFIHGLVRQTTVTTCVHLGRFATKKLATTVWNIVVNFGDAERR